MELTWTFQCGSFLGSVPKSMTNPKRSSSGQSRCYVCLIPVERDCLRQRLQDKLVLTCFLCSMGREVKKHERGRWDLAQAWLKLKLQALKAPFRPSRVCPLHISTLLVTPAVPACLAAVQRCEGCADWRARWPVTRRGSRGARGLCQGSLLQDRGRVRRRDIDRDQGLKIRGTWV